MNETLKHQALQLSIKIDKKFVIEMDQHEKVVTQRMINLKDLSEELFSIYLSNLGVK